MSFFGMGGSEDDLTAGTSVNTEDGFSSLFKDVGNTLANVTKQGISTIGATVKTALAQKIMNSAEGKAQIAAYKWDYVTKYLPWVAVGLIAVLIGGRFIKS
jgi:hypothetical protein